MLQQNRLILPRLPQASTLPFIGRQAAMTVPDIQIQAVNDLDAIEREWRDFEQRADCTVFQTFDWLSLWHQHVGQPAGVMPIIVTGRRPEGALLFILPLAVERAGAIRRLSFFGRELCDYNAPLLAPDFSDRVSTDVFRRIWDETRHLLQADEAFRHHVVCLDKMPEMVGTQRNPMTALATTLHPSGAHQTTLCEDWERFYLDKRSPATRRRDRTKRKKLGELGELSFKSAHTSEEIQGTLAVLFSQKSRWFERMGLPDLFAKPGHAAFFSAVAERGRDFVHVSRLDVGSTCAAANLGLVFRDCYYHILASYDEGPASRFGPGAAHMHELMRYAIAQKCQRFDFTIGDESYKRDWSDSSLVLYDHLSGVGLFGRCASALMHGRLRIKRWIKHSPLLWAAASRLRALMGSVVRNPVSQNSTDH